MSSSSAGVLAFLLLASTASAQRELAVEAYNRATRIEREGLEISDRDAGSQHLRRAQQDCLVSALASFAAMRSKLAAWRVLSCAAGTDNWLLAYLAAEAFLALDSSGVAGWSHPSFTEEETSRVRAAAVRAQREVGSISIPVPTGGVIEWGAPRRPLVLAEGALPNFDTDTRDGPARRGPIQIGSTYYMPAGTRVTAVVRVPGGRERRVDTIVNRLNDTMVTPTPTMSAERAEVREVPTRSEISRALSRVRGQVELCLDPSVLAMTTVIFRGADGSAAEVRAQGVSVEVERCIGREVREVRLQPFRRSEVRVTYPFTGRAR